MNHPKRAPGKRTRGKTPLTAAQCAKIRALDAEGTLSQRAIAAQLGVSHTSVQRVLAQDAPPAAPLKPAKSARKTAPVATVPDVADLAEPFAAPADVGDPEALIKYQIAQCQRAQAKCTRDGDALGAQRYARTITLMVPVLARLKRDDNVDAIVIPRAELETRLADLRETMKALTAEGPLCRVCGERIRAGWADEVAAEQAARVDVAG